MPATALEGRSESEMQGAPLPGLVSGKPMSFYPVQPPIWSFPNGSASNEDTDDWLTRLLKGVRGQ